MSWGIPIKRESTFYLKLIGTIPCKKLACLPISKAYTSKFSWNKGESHQ